jgi:hypothetical protein
MAHFVVACKRTDFDIEHGPAARSTGPKRPSPFVRARVWCATMAVMGPLLRPLAAAVLFVSACTTALPTATPTGTTDASPATTAIASLSPGASVAPAPSPGFFAFDAESIVGYYVTLGYSCFEARPSAQAAGYSFQSCQLVDTDGRTRTIGIVTDAAGDVADAFASVRGAAGEAILDPAAVLEPFAAFLGAMLGEVQGESLLPWLAGNLGEAYVTTTLGDLTIATYSESPQDHSKLYVEIANRAYLDAPSPAASPAS